METLNGYDDLADTYIVIVDIGRISWCWRWILSEAMAAMKLGVNEPKKDSKIICF